jgi:subtilase family serine protease
MKSTKIFALLLAITILVAAAGMLPSNGTAKMAPFALKGPLQGPFQKVSGGTQPIYNCQAWNSIPTCYSPAQMRHAYGLDTVLKSGFTGAGRNIVIVDAFQSPTLIADLDAFDVAYGLPLSATFLTIVAPDGLTPFDPTNMDMQSWAGEITLDVEWAHAMAPGARIVLDLAASDQDTDILSAETYAVNNDLGSVMSQSFGENESCVDPLIMAAEHALYLKATKQGMTIFASSGDEGAAQMTCDGLSWTQAVSSPASDPLVTAVGGTTLHAAGYCTKAFGCNPGNFHPLPGTYQFEVGWNELGVSPTGNIASGGGYSVIYKRPAFQKITGLVAGTQRGVPDVSYSAAVLHGVIVYFQGFVYLFGGTSAGSPQWAAITAIADQKAGHRLGFINADLYLMARSTSYLTIFHDVLIGSNAVTELDSTATPVFVPGFAAGHFWDAVTGLGSPNTSMVNKLSGFGMNFQLPPLDALSPNTSNSASGSTGKVQPH